MKYFYKRIMRSRATSGTRGSMDGAILLFSSKMGAIVVPQWAGLAAAIVL